MAIYHVCHVFPSKNDLIDFEQIRLQDEEEKGKKKVFSLII